MKSLDVKSSIYIDFDLENDEKDLKIDVGDHARYRNTKAFLQKVTLQTDPKKFL